ATTLAKLVDELFKVGATLTDRGGLMFSSAADLRASVFGIDDSKISQWRHGRLRRNGPGATLKFTDELLEIFSCRKLPKSGFENDAVRVYELWKTEFQDNLSLAVNNLTHYARLLQEIRAQTERDSLYENIRLITNVRDAERGRSSHSK